MRGRSVRAKGPDWLGRGAAATLAGVVAAALVAAVRLAAAAAGGGEDLLAELRARTERRLTAEREQIRPALEAAARGDAAAARRAAGVVVAGLEGNSQLRLLLADLHRAAGEAAPALREYRRAVDLVRDYADRRSPWYIGAGLEPWLREVRPGLAGAGLADLHYLERALAGGCS